MQNMRISQILKILKIIITNLGNRASNKNQVKIWSRSMKPRVKKMLEIQANAFSHITIFEFMQGIVTNEMCFFLKIWFSGIKVNQVSHANIYTDAQIQMWKILIGL